MTQGICQCGCGERTNPAPQKIRAKGLLKGQPYKYVAGHGRRLSPVEYLEQDCGYETPCWVWQRATQKNGYAVTTIAGQTQRAHRVYYEYYVGPIPEGRHIDHLCRNRACVNPAHLEPVTTAENVQRGKSAKLVKAQVLDIRRRASSERHADLAIEFDVSKHQIWCISARRQWVGV